MTTKLDEIRDELAENQTAFCWCAGPCCSGCEEKVKKLFSMGWDAAMERVKPLVEALELLGSDISEPHYPIALEALAKFRG